MKEKGDPVALRLKAAKKLESNNTFEMAFWLYAQQALNKGEVQPFVDLLQRLLKPTKNQEDDRLHLLAQAVDNLAACFKIGLAAFVKEKQRRGRKAGSPRIRSLLIARDTYFKLRKHGALFPMDGIPPRQRFSVEKALKVAVAEQNAYADQVGKLSKYSKITVDQLREVVAGKDTNVRKASKRKKPA